MKMLVPLGGFSAQRGTKTLEVSIMLILRLPAQPRSASLPFHENGLTLERSNVGYFFLVDALEWCEGRKGELVRGWTRAGQR